MNGDSRSLLVAEPGSEEKTAAIIESKRSTQVCDGLPAGELAPVSA
ncbi:MAG: hypothetical protein JWO45_1801 [Spartobacteria bacterium]|nr:hypothetical protein [Spartobacteria bacterium]